MITIQLHVEAANGELQVHVLERVDYCEPTVRGSLLLPDWLVLRFRQGQPLLDRLLEGSDLRIVWTGELAPVAPDRRLLRFGGLLRRFRGVFFDA